MNEINTENSKKSSNKVFSWKNLPYVLSFIALLNLSNPSEAKIVNSSKFTPEITEVLEDSDIITNIEQRTGVKLPKGYAEKIRNFMINNKTLKKEIATKFTKDFIEKEMQSDRGGISKENQILFICCAVGYNYNQDFYTGDDGDDNRMSEFEKAIDSIEACQRRYKEEFLLHMQQISADAQQISAESKEKAMKLDSLGLKEIYRFYINFKKNPNIVTDSEIQQATKVAKDVIQNCKKYGIDYRNILLEEVGDEKKVDKILEFYGIKDPDIAQTKSDYYIVDHYNPAKDAPSEVKEQWYEQRKINAMNESEQIELAHDVAKNKMNNDDNNLVN